MFINIEILLSLSLRRLFIFKLFFLQMHFPARFESYSLQHGETLTFSVMLEIICLKCFHFQFTLFDFVSFQVIWQNSEMYF